MAQMTLNPSGDAQIISDGPTTNYGTHTALDVGEVPAATSTRRSLLKFDLSSLSGKLITSAVLRLYDGGADYTNNTRTMYVNRMKRAWTEAGVTWNKYDGTNNWTTAGGMTNSADCEVSPSIGSISMPNPPVSGYVEITLDTTSVQEWIDGTFTNNGIGLSMGTESDDMHEFNSKEAANKPELVIVYPDDPSGFFALLM